MQRRDLDLDDTQVPYRPLSLNHEQASHSLRIDNEKQGTVWHVAGQDKDLAAHQADAECAPEGGHCYY